MEPHLEHHPDHMVLLPTIILERGQCDCPDPDVFWFVGVSWLIFSVGFVFPKWPHGRPS